MQALFAGDIVRDDVRSAMDDHKPVVSVSSGARDEAAAPKKPYQKPAFRHERVFETMALACGKHPGGGGNCKGNEGGPHSS